LLAEHRVHSDPDEPDLTPQDWTRLGVTLRKSVAQTVNKTRVTKSDASGQQLLDGLQ
jgi:hypothetical protein